MDRANRKTMRLLDRILIGVLVLLAMLLAGLQAARAGEIVPSIGLSRSTGSDGPTRTFYGVALRGGLIPMVKSELAVAYRSEPQGSDLDVKMWPLTASLWLAPMPTFYLGGGAGYYHTTLDYRDQLGIPDQTSREFGTHLGGGITIPLLPAIASLDLNGRYVHLREKESLVPPGRVTQSFWSTSLGVAIKF